MAQGAMTDSGCELGHASATSEHLRSPPFVEIQGSGRAQLASRELERQQVEALVKSQVVNRMTALGMPKSERVSVG